MCMCVLGLGLIPSSHSLPYHFNFSVLLSHSGRNICRFAEESSYLCFDCVRLLRAGLVTCVFCYCDTARVLYSYTSYIRIVRKCLDSGDKLHANAHLTRIFRLHHQQPFRSRKQCRGRKALTVH